MKQEMINKILSEELSRGMFENFIRFKLPIKEREILNMTLGLEDKTPQSLEKVCKKFRITKKNYQNILKKALKEFIEEKEKLKKALKKLKEERKKWKPIVDKPPEWRGLYLKPDDFSNFRELKDFVWRLFEKGYRIDKTEFLQYTDLPPYLADLAFRREIWICNKKVRKCYIFVFITEKEYKLFDLIEDLFSLHQKTKRNKKK